jgi:hypothetical protein
MASIGNLSAKITADGRQLMDEFNRIDNRVRRSAATISGSMSKALGPIAKGGLKALGLAELASLARNEIRTIITDFESIKGISPEAKDSIYQFGEALTALRGNVQSLLAQAIGGFAKFGTEIGLFVGRWTLPYGKESADLARQQMADEARAGRQKTVVAKQIQDTKRLREAEMEALDALGKAQRDARAGNEDLEKTLFRVRAQYDGLAEVVQQSKGDTPEAIKARTEAYKGMTEALKEEARVMGEIDKRAEEVRRTFAQFGGELAASFENAVFAGGKLRDMLKSIAQDLARLIFREAITKPLAGIITGGLSSIFGGGKAGGGMVSSGTTYLVGERGPELFTPRTAGNIIPNHQLNGAAYSEAVTINYNVQAGVSRSDLVPILRAHGEAVIADLRDRDRRRK